MSIDFPTFDVDDWAMIKEQKQTTLKEELDEWIDHAKGVFESIENPPSDLRKRYIKLVAMQGNIIFTFKGATLSQECVLFMLFTELAADFVRAAHTLGKTRQSKRKEKPWRAMLRNNPDWWDETGDVIAARLAEKLPEGETVPDVSVINKFRKELKGK